MMTYGLIGVAILIVAGLAFYAGRLLFLVKVQKESQLKAQHEHNEDVVKSLKIIASATIQGQCELAEASIRLSVLMGRLQLKDKRREAMEAAYTGIIGLYENIKHLDTHNKRKALKKSERHKQDVFRLEQEQVFEEQIKGELPSFENFKWHKA